MIRMDELTLLVDGDVNEVRRALVNLMFTRHVLGACMVTNLGWGALLWFQDIGRVAILIRIIRVGVAVPDRGAVG